MNPTTDQPVSNPDQPAWTAGKPPAPPARPASNNGPLIVGAFLILIGLFFLARQFLPGLNMEVLWPLAAVIGGLVLIVAAFVLPRR